MSDSSGPGPRQSRWRLPAPGQQPGPLAQEPVTRPGHSWWQVICLTGVDYFSTIGYQPAVAFLAAGLLSPFATILLIVLTLCCALPVYRRVAGESPHGSGSIAMLERILPWWPGKLLVLVLLGFAATDFLITMTLSAADASQHALENPYAPGFLHGHQLVVTLVLLAVLGAVFLRGFTEAIGIAIVLVAVYLSLNAVVLSVATFQLVSHPHQVSNWWTLLTAQHPSALGTLGAVLIAFPGLALGLSGFETGVLVMPQISGGHGSAAEQQQNRIQATRRLLAVAAGIMSVLLLVSSVTTTMLIPAREFQPGGAASGRAVAYLAHVYLGNGLGTAYDIATIAILWFAGASAMAGLLNLVPRYLPRYGMAPAWARAIRPLVLIFTAVALLVTWIFGANVAAQAGAYATGVLVLITSAAVAVTLSAWRRGQRRAAAAYLLVFAVFAYTTGDNMVKRPDGLKIGACFIGAIILISLVSRVTRSLELRATAVTFDVTAQRYLAEAAQAGQLHIIANDPDERDIAEYADKLAHGLADLHIPAGQQPILLEVTVPDASEFETSLEGAGEERFGYRIITTASPAVPNSIAAMALEMRDRTGLVPHLYFDWAEGSPVLNVLRYLLLGAGEVAAVTHEVLRRAEPDAARRPRVHVG